MIFHDRPPVRMESLKSRTKVDKNNRQVLSCPKNIARRKEIWQVNYMV